jgi:hypothetical protein
MNSDTFTISDTIIVNAPVDVVYEQLINPREQLKWNTLYLQAEVKPEGDIETGSVMTGTFKGSGKATVHFEDVVKNRQFTHYSQLKLFNIVYLGEFRHHYQVEDDGGNTRFTQTVVVRPKGLGKLLKTVLASNFKKRLPESFAEFRKYAERL